MIEKASPSTLKSQFSAVLLFGAACAATAQVPAAPLRPVQTGPIARNYAGPQVHIPGIYVTPIANAPFSATVKIVSHQSLLDGTENIVTTVNHIARASSGVIYNERRRLMPVTFKGEPLLLEGHIYNPSDHRNTFLEPPTHIARQTISPRPATLTPGPTAPGPKLPGTVETDLGIQTLNNVELRGLRRERTIAAELSGTGKPIVITDDYWYSPDLFVYLIIRHDDPRTGEQLVAVSEIERHEPDSSRFVVPPDYKIVDETPPTPTRTNHP